MSNTDPTKSNAIVRELMGAASRVVDLAMGGRDSSTLPAHFNQWPERKKKHYDNCKAVLNALGFNIVPQGDPGNAMKLD